MSMKTLGAVPRMGLKEVDSKNSFNLDLMIEEFKTMPLFETLARLSSINLVLSNSKSSEEIDKILRTFHLNEVLQQKASHFEKNGKLSGVIFNRQSSLFLLLLAKKYCKEGGSITQPSLDLNLGLFFLVANDFISYIDHNESVDGDTEGNLRRAAPLISRQYLFNHHPQERYTIPQSWLVYELLKDKVSEHVRFDLSQNLKKSRGFSLNDYYQVLAIIYSYWSNQTIENWNHKYIILNPETVFSKIGINPAYYQSILKSLSNTYIVTRDLPPFEDAEKWRKEIYEQFEHRLKPLILINGIYICSDFNFIRNAFWDGPYHMILTDYPKSKTSKGMLDYLGYSNEKFIRYLGKDSFGDKFVDLETGEGHPLGDGVIKLSEDWIVVLESKAARPGIDMVSGDKPITELNDFKKLVSSGLRQMNKRILEYRKNSGFTGRVSPILITANNIPQHSIIWNLMLLELKELEIFKEENYDFPFLIGLESWNVICSIQKTVISLETILNMRQSDDDSKKSNPSQFLYEAFFKEKGITEPPHPELLSLYEDRMDELLYALFQRSSTKRIYPTGTWKKVFEID